MTERLNLVFGFNWDFEVTDKQILEDEVIVEAKLTVRTPGGQTIVKTQFGGADIKRHASGAKNGRPLSIADDYKAAASDALKKCASLLGIGLDLYGRDRPYEADEPQPQAPPQARPVRAASSLAAEDTGVIDVGAEIGKLAEGNNGLCTSAQWREISKLAAKASMDVPELCASLGVSTLSQLTEARAQRVIYRLRELAGGESTSRAS